MKSAIAQKNQAAVRLGYTNVYAPVSGTVSVCADPFTYAVDGFKCLLLKETTLSAVWGDMLFLSVFAAITLGIAIPLFKRTL